MVCEKCPELYLHVQQHDGVIWSFGLGSEILRAVSDSNRSMFLHGQISTGLRDAHQNGYGT